MRTRPHHRRPGHHGAATRSTRACATSPTPWPTAPPPVTTLIASKVAEVSENLGRGVDNAILRIADAETGVTARIDGAASTVGDSARTAADIIETGVNSARKAITDMVDQRLGTLPEAITARADITAERLASLNTAINTALVQSMTDLEAGADRIEETISTRIVAATAEHRGRRHRHCRPHGRRRPQRARADPDAPRATSTS